MKTQSETNLIRRFLSADIAARALQMAGLLRFACVFLQGIILVKAGVPVHTVGQVEIVFFVANFFSFFWQNGASNAMMSWASGDDRAKVAGSIFGATHLQALIAIVMMWGLLQIPVDAKFSIVSSGVSAAALIAYVFFSIPSGAIVYSYLIRKKYSAILWFTGISQITQVAIVAVTVMNGYSIEEMIMALAVFAVAKWLFVMSSGKWFVSGNTLSGAWAFFVFALPLVLHAFNGGIMDYVDGWIVSMFYGEGTFAQYRFGARELPFNALLIGGLMSGLVHTFKSDNHLNVSKLRSETSRIMSILFPLNCILILLSVPLYTLVYSEDFVLSARIFNIYTLTLLSRIIMNQVFCYVHHHNWVLTASTAVEVVVNIALSLLLMQWLGLIGIPLATVLAYGLQKAFLVWYVRAKFTVRFREYVPVRQCIWYFAAILLCVFISEMIYF